MRRLLFGVFTASFLVGMLTGCSSTRSGDCEGGSCGSHRPRGLGLICHTSGVCDCDCDEDPCAHRAPWASRGISYPLVGQGGHFE